MEARRVYDPLNFPGQPAHGRLAGHFGDGEHILQIAVLPQQKLRLLHCPHLVREFEQHDAEDAGQSVGLQLKTCAGCHPRSSMVELMSRSSTLLKILASSVSIGTTRVRVCPSGMRGCVMMDDAAGSVEHDVRAIAFRGMHLAPTSDRSATTHSTNHDTVETIIEYGAIT